MPAWLQTSPAPLGLARSVQEGERLLQYLLQYLLLPCAHLGSLSRPPVRGGLLESFLSLCLSPSAKLGHKITPSPFSITPCLFSFPTPL